MSNYIPDPPLSPEEQAVIDAMRAGRKVTVEAPKMPRRCWASYCAETLDPWRLVYKPRARFNIGPHERVELIELTPEVSAALLAAGIRWEDAPTGNRLPEGVPPLPEGAVYLGVGGSFETAGMFGGWSWNGEKPDTWAYDIHWAGSDTTSRYAAPAGSEIVRLNKKQIDPEGSPQRKLLDNPTPTL